MECLKFVSFVYPTWACKAWKRHASSPYLHSSHLFDWLILKAMGVCYTAKTHPPTHTQLEAFKVKKQKCPVSDMGSSTWKNNARTCHCEFRHVHENVQFSSCTEKVQFFIGMFSFQTLGKNWLQKMHSVGRESTWRAQLQHDFIWKCQKEALPLCWRGGDKAPSG